MTRKSYEREDGHMLRGSQGKFYCVNCGMEIPDFPNDQNLPKCPAQEGLKSKYLLSKVDGTPVDPDGDYFILKLNSKNQYHREASIKAILVYAKTIEVGFPQLAADILKKYGGWP